jgi:hypothetical protein
MKSIPNPFEKHDPHPIPIINEIHSKPLNPLGTN